MRCSTLSKLNDSVGGAISLPVEESPVVRDLGNGLVVAYIVDAGNEFHFIQDKHLRETGFSLDDFHRRSVENLAGFSSSRLEIRKHAVGFMPVLAMEHYTHCQPLTAPTIAIRPHRVFLWAHFNNGPI